MLNKDFHKCRKRRPVKTVERLSAHEIYSVSQKIPPAVY